MTYEIIPLSGRAKDLTGKTYCNVLVIGPVGKHKTCGNIIWRCLCSCGRVKNHDSAYLRRKQTNDCTCLIIRRKKRKRAQVTKCSHALYPVYEAMRARCNNPNVPSYRNYGGRGIGICKRWDDFWLFVSDMGDKPSIKHSIDRIDNDGNYAPGNCRWATAKQQQSNKRTNINITHNGETRNVSEWSEINRIKRVTIYARLNRGWDEVDAITTSAG